MSKNRLKYISRFITFDHKTTRADLWKTNKFARMIGIFEAMNERNVKIRYPFLLLAIDKTLYPYRGFIDSKQYDPSRPTKHGLLYRSLCDFMTTYTYFSLVYAKTKKHW